MHTHIRESLATSNMLALMRFFSGMCSNMDSQGTSLYEAFPTAWCKARIWPLIGVYAVVSLEIRFSVEGLIELSQLMECEIRDQGIFLLYCKVASHIGRDEQLARSQLTP